MIVADLPGSYSLSAGSDEEIITLDYIASGNADLALVMADASQLKRSLYMLADFVGMQVPAILVLNMMDVAKGQGITIDTEALSRKLGIPVVPMSAIRKKDYRTLYETIEAALAQKPVITGQAMESAKEKTDYIDGLLMDFKPYSIVYSLIKTAVFAYIITSISAFYGYNARGNSLEVGTASTRAVVASSVVIMIFNLILTQVLLI